jgi:hypothetical protein
MRKLLSQALIAMAFTTLAAFGADNSLGAWKFSPEKSKYTPAPMPLKSLTITREAADGGVKVTTVGERADGTKVDTTYTAKYDGSPASVSGAGALYDTISIKQVNANTLTDERKKTGGSYQASGRYVISSDGKVMTWTSKGTNQDSKPFTATLVYEKQSPNLEDNSD